MTSPNNLETLNYLLAQLNNGSSSAVVTQNADGTWSIAVDIGPGNQYASLPPLEGVLGDAGEAQFPLWPQSDNFTSPKDLPNDLTNTKADIGRFWLIYQTNETGGVTSSGAYIWYGEEYRFLPFGNQGPPGDYGVINPSVTLLPPDNYSGQVVTGTGDPSDPYELDLQLSVPQGPFGPSAFLASFPDVDESTPPDVGQFLAWDGSHWTPQSVGDIIPLPYTLPQGAFQSQLGITWADTITVAAITIPAQTFSWKPLVWGQIKMFELQLLPPDGQLIGAEVMMDDPTGGQMVARGFGNDANGIVKLVPHTSTPTSPDVAMTPSNNVALVPAGQSCTLYLNLVNEGLLAGIFNILNVALYDFDASQGAEMFTLVCPSSDIP